MTRYIPFIGVILASYCFFVADGSTAESLWLVRDGHPCATIVFGRENGFAAERLQRFLAEKSGANVPMAPADDWQAGSKGCVVLIGSEKSNSALQKLAAKIGLKIDPAELTDQGYVAKRVEHDGRSWLILAGGGRDGAQYAVVDLFHWALHCGDRSVWLDSLDTRQVPRMHYRWFWNWDSRMEWGGVGDLGAEMAAGDAAFAYAKKPEAFLIDGKRCVDYMADHKFNAMILWGFLRDCHGGVEASQELCRYAAERGVRILPGVGTSGYGGYYYEGDHEFNSATWVKKHPELWAVKKDGTSYAVPCPSKKANQEWLDRGARWLFETFEIGGVNLEMGDFFVCYCDDCRKARAAIDSDEPDHYKDMAISQGVTLKNMRRLAPDAWLSYATYTGYTAKMMETPPKFLSMIPEDAICQWTLSGMAEHWDASLRPMAKHNFGFVHWCNRPSKSHHDFYVSEIQSLCRQAAAAGFEGLATYGELSDSQPNTELSYLAWEAFLWNPDMTAEEFADRRLARLYGGPESARELLKIIPLIRGRNERSRAKNFSQAMELAKSAARLAAPEGKAAWERLLAFLEARRNDP